MALLRPNSCRVCKHVRPRPSAKVGEPEGECHEHPPSTAVFPVPGPNGQMAFMTHTTFTNVNYDWDCSRWQPKIQQEN